MFEGRVRDQHRELDQVVAGGAGGVLQIRLLPAQWVTVECAAVAGLVCCPEYHAREVFPSHREASIVVNSEAERFTGTSGTLAWRVAG